jgi:hypothetical protein
MANFTWAVGNDPVSFQSRVDVMGHIHRETLQSHAFKIQELQGALQQAEERILLLEGYLKAMSEGEIFALPPSLGI